MTLPEIITTVAGGYEVLTRTIPSKKNVSLIHGILKVLVFVSDLLNRKKKSINEKQSEI